MSTGTGLIIQTLNNLNQSSKELYSNKALTFLNNNPSEDEIENWIESKSGKIQFFSLITNESFNIVRSNDFLFNLFLTSKTLVKELFEFEKQFSFLLKQKETEIKDTLFQFTNKDINILLNNYNYILELLNSPKIIDYHGIVSDGLDFDMKVLEDHLIENSLIENVVKNREVLIRDENNIVDEQERIYYKELDFEPYITEDNNIELSDHTYEAEKSFYQYGDWTWEIDEIQDQVVFLSFNVYFEHNTDLEIKLYDSENNFIISFRMNNSQQWYINDFNGQDRIIDNDTENDWVYMEFQFDWDKGYYFFYGENLNKTNVNRHKSGQITYDRYNSIFPSNINKIEFDDQGGSDAYFENFVVHEKTPNYFTVNQLKDYNWLDDYAYILNSQETFYNKFFSFPITITDFNKDLENIEWRILDESDNVVYKNNTDYQTTKDFVIPSNESVEFPGMVNIGTLIPDGQQELQYGTAQKGFFGEVLSENFISGSELSSQVGLTSGTLVIDNVVWLKFNYQNYVMYIPKKPIRSNVSFEAIYEAGAAYGSMNTGNQPYASWSDLEWSNETPTETQQDTIVTINDFKFIVRLMQGTDGEFSTEQQTDPYNEWNQLMYAIHEETDSENWGINYTDSDLQVNGYRNWVQESPQQGSTQRVYRGFNGVQSSSYYDSDATYYWRPILVITQII